MTAEEIAEVLKVVNANRPQVTQTLNFNAPIGQQIAHVDKIEAHFDKDIGMHVVDAEVVDTEISSEELSPANLFTHQQGILEDGDMWILLVAAKARKKAFKHLPDFVDWAFDTFQVPYKKEICIKKLQAHMRNQGWDTVKNQETMFSFIKKFRQREAERKNDIHKANAIYVAIRDINM